jgi:phage host-nuclease inhibitor protein Gam
MTDIIPDEEATPEMQQQWVIDNISMANWYTHKLLLLDAEEAALKVQHQAKLTRVKSERAALEYRHATSLEHWAKEYLEASDSKLKSVVLDYVTVAFRSVKGGLKITDKDAAFGYASGAGNNNLIKTTYSLNADAYQKFAEDTLRDGGEVVVGAEIVEAYESFSVRFPKPALAPNGAEGSE